MSELALAFLLTLLAGLATGLGSLVAFFVRRESLRFLALSSGFSAGVMLYVSFVEIFFKGEEALVAGLGAGRGPWVLVAAFFSGMILTALIDALVPGPENPHQPPSEDARAALQAGTAPPAHLLRTGLFASLAVAIHNFPEGLATFLAALQDPPLGAAIAVAVALHNIPEGIAIAVPIYYATGSRRKAFLYSFLSGLAEPVGAGIAFLGLRVAFGGGANLFPPAVMGALFAGVAGIMVYVSLDELLPASRAYGRGHESILGILAGMGVMAVTLLLV